MNFRSYRPGGGILNRPILAAALGLAALPANAQEEAAGLLQRDYANCGEYAETIAATEFKAEPDLFLCHGYDFKGLNLYGFFVFHGRDRFMLHMTTNKHGFCSGMGEQVIVELDDRSHASASGRFDYPPNGDKPPASSRFASA